MRQWYHKFENFLCTSATCSSMECSTYTILYVNKLDSLGHGDNQMQPPGHKNVLSPQLLPIYGRFGGSYPKYRTFLAQCVPAIVPEIVSMILGFYNVLYNVRVLLDTYSIDSSAKNIQGTLADKPDKADTLSHLCDAVHLHTVKHRKHGRKAHGNEHSGPVRTPC